MPPTAPTTEEEITKAIKELESSLLENVEAKRAEADAKIALQVSHHRKQKSLELLMALMKD